MQMNFFEDLINDSIAKESLLLDQKLSAKCILAASASSSKSTKEFLYSVGNFGFLTGKLTDKQRLAVTATLRGVAMAS